MQLIAGLGNPGARYMHNRHNIGFMAIDEIQRHGFSPFTKKFQAEIAENTIHGEKVLLVKPQNFMNLSGQAIGEVLRFYKLPIENLHVFYDELDLEPGKVRIKTGGGSGGHKGIRSIDAHCGKDYQRIRLGIGHPGRKELVNNHVLGDFAKADYIWLEPLLQAIGDHIDLLLENKNNEFMNKLSLTQNGQKAETAKKPAKQQSHIRQARNSGAKTPPTSGPMADMLKKLFGKDS